MKQTTKKRIRRISLLAILCLLTVAILCGCGSSNKKTLTPKPISVESGVNSLSGEQMSQVAQLLASTCTTDFDTQQMLIAAYRGYDMTNADFNDANVNESVDDKAGRDAGKMINMNAVKNLITAANAKASTKLQFDYNGINKEDVKTLVAAFQTDVALDAPTGFSLDVLLTWIGKALGWLTNTLCFGSYIVGICLFAVIIEILMLPFAIRQQKHSIRQASLRPKEMAIRNKYKGRTDQVTMRKMQEEIQEFYQRENVSPYSGCLPLLIQLPIIMALYSIVMNPLHYVLGQASGISTALSTYYTAARAAGGMGGALGNGQNTITLLAEIKEKGADFLGGLANFQYFSNGGAMLEKLDDMATKIPNFSIGGINFGLTPSFEGAYVLLLVPVLTFGVYFLTSKLNRKFMMAPSTAAGGADERQVACSNNMMDITMPLMSTFFTFMVPALIGVYWIFRSLIGLLKQYIISRIMPLPVFTKEDYKRAEKEMAGKRVVKKSENVGKVRSLHHIDDEDFEDTRERALARKAALEAQAQEQKPQVKDTPFEAAPIKEDDRKNKKGKAQKAEEVDGATDEHDNQN